MRPNFILACVAVFVVGCSQGPTTRYLLDYQAPGKQLPERACFQGFYASTRSSIETSLPGRPFLWKMLCDLPGEHGSDVGWGTFVLRHGPESWRGVCGIHLFPTRLRGPLSFEKTIFALVEDPIVAFKLRGLVAGIDTHREFHRVINVDGVHVELEQFIANFANAPYIEIEINGCGPLPDETLVATDGAPIQFAEP